MDRTQHVLDTIDGALGDWSTSGDAMRWTPEPPAASPRLFGGPIVLHTAVAGADPADVAAWTRVGASRDQMQRFLNQLGEAVRPVIEMADRLAASMGMRLDELGEALAEMRPLAHPRPEAEDPKARALRLQQSRNTGPSRDVTRQRRPRRHVG